MTRAINMHGHWPRQVLAALLLWLPLLAWAQPRAWLDRDRIAMGDTVTLNVESDQGAPDFTPLRTDFDLSGQTSSRQVEWSNGSMQQRNLYGVALTPRRSGALVVPGLQVGSVRTAPLTLQVDAAAVAGPDSNAVAFIEPLSMTNAVCAAERRRGGEAVLRLSAGLWRTGAGYPGGCVAAAGRR